jgi:hypothetical protein
MTNKNWEERFINEFCLKIISPKREFLWNRSLDDVIHFISNLLKEEKMKLIEEIIERINEDKKWEYDFQGKRSMALKNFNEGLSKVLTLLENKKKDIS